jgi:hypothetical protein
MEPHNAPNKYSSISQIRRLMLNNFPSLLLLSYTSHVFVLSSPSDKSCPGKDPSGCTKKIKRLLFHEKSISQRNTFLFGAAVTLIAPERWSHGLHLDF